MKKICPRCQEHLVPIEIFPTQIVNMGYGKCGDGFYRDRRTTVSEYCCPKCKEITKYLNWDSNLK